MKRCFFAIWPDEATVASLHRIAAGAHQTCGGRLMRRETLHLTLAFLGDIPTARVTDAMHVADTLAVEPFELTLDRLGYWKHNRIVWAGGVSPRLTFLADSLGKGLRDAGFALDARPFVAHVTLLRDAHCSAAPPLSTAMAWPVGEFVLAESIQSRYDIIGRWPLS